MEKRMIDGHIHIERGEYSLDWIQRFVDRAVETGLTEIRLLEHNFLFPELLRALVRHNVRIVTSSDAHRPEDVGYRIKELGEAVAAAGGEKLCN